MSIPNGFSTTVKSRSRGNDRATSRRSMPLQRKVSSLESWHTLFPIGSHSTHKADIIRKASTPQPGIRRELVCSCFTCSSPASYSASMSSVITGVIMPRSQALETQVRLVTPEDARDKDAGVVNDLPDSSDVLGRNALIENGFCLTWGMSAGGCLFQKLCDEFFSGRLYRTDQQTIFAQVEHVQRAAVFQSFPATPPQRENRLALARSRSSSRSLSSL